MAKPTNKIVKKGEEELSPVGDPETELPESMQGAAGSMVGMISTEDHDDAIAKGFVIEKVFTMKAGMRLDGVFVGEGEPIEMMRQDGEVVKVRTWRFRHPNGGMVARILGGSQLDSTLPKYPEGTLIRLCHMGQTEVKGGRRVNQYDIYHKLPPANRQLPANGA